VDTADASFDEVVNRAQSAATSASFYGYYDPVQCARMLEETAARRGGPLEISWHLNDRRAMPGSQDAHESGAGGVEGRDQAGRDVPIDEALAKLLPRTRLFWDRRMPSFDGALFIQVDSAPAPLASRQALPEGLPAVYFEVWADTRVFTTARIEEFARAMETVLVEAACDA
jgi:hypothetical protein